MLAGAVPRRSFRPFWIAPKGARRRGGEISLIKRCGAKPAGGDEPLPYGCKWDGRVWDPPLRRHKGHRGPTGVADGAPSGRALQGCATRHPPHHGGATSGGASKRVAQTALRFCRTVATGGRTARRQKPPRAGTFASGFRTKLSRKWGSGGGQHWRPIRADVATPGDLFAPFGSLQKGLAARWRRNAPK